MDFLANIDNSTPDEFKTEFSDDDNDGDGLSLGSTATDSQTRLRRTTQQTSCPRSLLSPDGCNTGAQVRRVLNLDL
jgi:hypothetical protein